MCYKIKYATGKNIKFHITHFSRFKKKTIAFIYYTIVLLKYNFLKITISDNSIFQKIWLQTSLCDKVSLDRQIHLNLKPKSPTQNRNFKWLIWNQYNENSQTFTLSNNIKKYIYIDIPLYPSTLQLQIACLRS